MTMHKFFTYGTLRAGQVRHGMLEKGRCKFLGEAVTEPKYTLVSLGAYPALLLTGHTEVKGEVYEIPDDILESIDWIEGYPKYYNRTEIITSLGPALAYYQTGPVNDLPVIDSGDWCNREAA